MFRKNTKSEEYLEEIALKSIGVMTDSRAELSRREADLLMRDIMADKGEILLLQNIRGILNTTGIRFKGTEMEFGHQKAMLEAEIGKDFEGKPNHRIKIYNPFDGIDIVDIESRSPEDVQLHNDKYENLGRFRHQYEDQPITFEVRQESMKTEATIFCESPITYLKKMPKYRRDTRSSRTKNTVIDIFKDFRIEPRLSKEGKKIFQKYYVLDTIGSTTQDGVELDFKVMTEDGRGKGIIIETRFPDTRKVEDVGKTIYDCSETSNYNIWMMDNKKPEGRIAGKNYTIYAKNPVGVVEYLNQIF